MYMTTGELCETCTLCPSKVKHGGTLRLMGMMPFAVVAITSLGQEVPAQQICSPVMNKNGTITP